MSYDLFKTEQDILEAAQAKFEDPKLTKQDLQDEFATLIKGYQKLFRTSKRLVRMSDRNEAQLNEVAKTLDEKTQALEALSDKLSKYLSPQVYEMIFSGEREAGLMTERKKLTVFFSDIKDFTATTEDLQPEDLTFLLNDYLTKMSEIALKHGGTIDKYIGDAVVIFFGDPISRGIQDDALACVKMAIEMQRRMVDLRAKWVDLGYERPFHIRAGINTGYCNVGNFGSTVRMDYTIIGGEVNLAARLEGICEPDGVTMSNETYMQVRDHIAADAMEPIRVKGIARDVHPYSVKDIFDEKRTKKRFIRKEAEGMRYFFDLERMDAKRRRRAAKELERIATRLLDVD
jgi:adenylate cyclase